MLDKGIGFLLVLLHLYLRRYSPSGSKMEKVGAGLLNVLGLVIIEKGVAYLL